MIAFQCSNCRTTLQRADAETGMTTICPSCNQKLIVPSPHVQPSLPVPGVIQPAPAEHDPLAFSGDESSVRHRRQRPLMSGRGLATAGAILFIALFVLGVGFAIFDAYWQSARTTTPNTRFTEPGRSSEHEDYITDFELREASLALEKSAASLNRLSQAQKKRLRPDQVIPYYESTIEDVQAVIAAHRTIASHHPTRADHKKVANDAKASVKQYEQDLRRLLAEYQQLAGQ